MRFIKRLSQKSGMPPGALVHVGDRKVEEVRIRVIDYDKDHVEEKEISEADACRPYKGTRSVTWIDVRGLHRVNVIQSVGETFGLHPLVLEDILNTSQRPKIEEFEDYVFLILKMLTYDEETDEVHVEQVSLVLGPSFVISFQEMEGDVFDPIRERIRKGGGRIRNAGADYLVFAILDAAVDHTFVLLEKIGDAIESIEDDLMDTPGPVVLDRIHVLKRELLFLRRSVWPLREVVGNLMKMEPGLVTERTEIYLRDVYDHTVQAIETVETFKDMASGLLDYHMSLMGNRMNEVMKVLTIIATIFIPLTFIAGIYGMNFEHMPELAWSWAYPAVLGIMAVIVLLMILWFKRKRFF